MQSSGAPSKLLMAFWSRIWASNYLALTGTCYLSVKLLVIFLLLALQSLFRGLKVSNTSNSLCSLSHCASISFISGVFFTMYPCSSLWSASAFTIRASKLLINNRVLVSTIPMLARTMSPTEASFSDISLQFVRILFAWDVKASPKPASLLKSCLIST